MTRPYTIIRRFLFELVGISLDRNYREVINLSFILPGLYLNVLETEKILQFWNKRRHSPAQEIYRKTNIRYSTDDVTKHMF